MTPVKVFAITEQHSGKRFHCRSDQSVLNAAQYQGLTLIPIGCQSGGCGVCKVTVIHGDFDSGPMSIRHICEQKRQVLACRVYPQGDLTIECKPASTTIQTGLMSENSVNKQRRKK